MVPKGDKFRGRPITFLTIINKDLCRTPPGEIKVKLNTKNDLDHLWSIAEDRTQWKRLSANTEEAAEASKSEHWVVNGDAVSLAIVQGAGLKSMIGPKNRN